MKKQNLNHIELNNKLIEAIESSDHFEIEELLINNADPNTVDSDGVPIIIKAYEHFQLSIVEILIEYGAELNATELETRIGDINRKDRSGIPVICLAAMDDLYQVLSFVIDNCADIQREELIDLLHTHL